MKDLNHVTVIGLGLLGGAISLAVLCSFTHVKVVGYTHRAPTCDKAGRLSVASEVVDDICQSVSDSDLVILAAPISTFEAIEDLKFAGKGFMDTSRVASGPANIWANILLTNASRAIDKVITELKKLQNTVKSENIREIEKLLENARDRRAKMINYKIKKKEMIS